MMQENERTDEERLRKVLADMGYLIFTLRGWFGKGFLAIRGLNDQLSAIIIRRLSSDKIELQLLEVPSTTKPNVLVNLRTWAKVNFSEHPLPYNPTKRGRAYKWRYLVRVGELREAAYAERGILTEDRDARQLVPTFHKKRR